MWNAARIDQNVHSIIRPTITPCDDHKIYSLSLAAAAVGSLYVMFHTYIASTKCCSRRRYDARILHKYLHFTITNTPLKLFVCLLLHYLFGIRYIRRYIDSPTDSRDLNAFGVFVCYVCMIDFFHHFAHNNRQRILFYDAHNFNNFLTTFDLNVFGRLTKT